MAHDCLYPALNLFLAIYESCLHDLGITKDKEINKLHFKEKIQNHLSTQEQNDRQNVIATYL